MQEIILSTKELSIGYRIKKRHIEILDDINISLEKGTLTALVGLNGAGKSTLLRTLSGAQQLLKGEIFLNGKRLSSYTNEQISHFISVVLTDKSIEMGLSVYELVKLGRTPYLSWQAKLSKQDNALITKALKVTHIDHLQDTPLSSLSDGQLQRALIARAIAQDTPIIILDEPSAHLDLHFKVSLYKLLNTLCEQENKTILYSTHDIELSLALCDKMIVIKDKKYHHNVINTLINDGVFDNFFTTEHLLFDPINKRFILQF